MGREEGVTEMREEERRKKKKREREVGKRQKEGELCVLGVGSAQ